MTEPMVTTYSMWSLFRNCRKACEWRYLEELVPLERDGNLRFGSLIHDCLERWHADRDLAAVLDRIDRAAAGRTPGDRTHRDWHLARAMMTGYAARYAEEVFDVVALEQTFEGPIVNPATGASSRTFVLAGKVDGIVLIDGEHFLLEHKCVTGGSRIYDHATGRRWRVDEMAACGIAPRVQAINPDGRLCLAEAEVPRPAGVRDVFRIALRSGRQLAVSENHPLLTHRGWVVAAALKSDDWVAVPRTTATRRGESPFSDAEVKLLGYLLGDGTFSKLAFTQTDGPVLDDFLGTLDEMAVDHRVERHPGKTPTVVLSRAASSPARLLLERVGLHGELTAEHKDVPAELYAIDDRQVGLLLGALWCSDGCVDVHEELRAGCTRVQQKVRIAYVSRSRALCASVQSLLLRLGINASVTRSSIAYGGSRRAVYTTRVVGRGAKRDFLRAAVAGRIPILKYPDRLDVALSKLKPGEDPRRTPKDVVEWLDQADVHWDRVDVVLVSGRQQMYDISVEGVHNFVVDDVITHNTASKVDADYLERLWTDFQIVLYAHYLEQTLGLRIAGVLYNVLVKARLKQGAGETEAEYEERRAALAARNKSGTSSAKRRMPESDEAYAARLAERYADPLMFHRERLYFSRDRFEALRAELWELTQSFLAARRRGVFYQNSAFCFQYGRACPYFALCRADGNPMLIENLYERVPPHEELRPAPDAQPAF